LFYVIYVISAAATGEIMLQSYVVVYLSWFCESWPLTLKAKIDCSARLPLLPLDTV